jgi:hypothetical protein
MLEEENCGCNRELYILDEERRHGKESTKEK